MFAILSTLGWQAWVTAGVIVAMMGALVREWARPDLVLLGGLAGLLLVGVVTPEQAFAGFSNSAVITVAALFVVAAGVERTGALGFLDHLLFPKKTARLGWALPRLMFSTAGLSAFLNNTPIVALFVPRVQTWASRRNVSASKLLIPLSYAAITGGMITLIGTSTNLVVSGLMEAEGYAGLGFFDVTWVGLPAALAMMLYMTLVGHRLLPVRQKQGAMAEDGLRDCLFEVRVAQGSPLVGQTIEEAGLRSLGAAYLGHVRRAGRVIPASPEVGLQAGDVLTFAGDLAMLEALLQRPGLERTLRAVEDDQYETLPLDEAVVAASSNLVGKTLREAAFRDHYQGVVLAIQRKDEQVEGPLGRIPIKAGDLLLVEARNGFDSHWNATRDEFYLVAPRRPTQAKPQRWKAALSLLIFAAMIGAMASGLVSVVTASFAAALAVIATRCLRAHEARRAVDVQVLVVIAAALGIGKAVEASGLAALMATGLLTATGSLGLVATLVALYLATNVLTELITHKAAAVLMLPVALSVAASLNLNPSAFAVLIAVAAAGSFATPIGYQTNLMVMAAGGYRFKDYLRVGIPASLIIMAVAVTVIYLHWLR